MTSFEREWCLTAAEKRYEVVAFDAYRRDSGNYTNPAKGRYPGSGYIDREILPLVDALNLLPGVCTTQSCSGHHGAAGYYRPGQLYLRLDERVTAEFEHDVVLLVSRPYIRTVRKWYAFEGQLTPHETIDITFDGLGDGQGALDRSGAAIRGFFELIASRAAKRVKEASCVTS